MLDPYALKSARAVLRGLGMVTSPARLPDQRKAVASSKPTTYTDQEESTMTTAIILHEVQDGAVWAKAWKKGPGSRHEMFGKLRIKCRTFRDPNNPNATGLIGRDTRYGEIPRVAAIR
jgi:hypothetical protein